MAFTEDKNKLSISLNSTSDRDRTFESNATNWFHLPNFSNTEPLYDYVIDSRRFNGTSAAGTPQWYVKQWNNGFKEVWLVMGLSSTYDYTARTEIKFPSGSGSGISYYDRNLSALFSFPITFEEPPHALLSATSQLAIPFSITDITETSPGVLRWYYPDAKPNDAGVDTGPTIQLYYYGR